VVFFLLHCICSWSITIHKLDHHLTLSNQSAFNTVQCLALPLFFPNIRSLNWGEYEAEEKLDKSTQLLFKEQWVKRRKLERIVSQSYNVCFATYFLNSTACISLKHLDVSFLFTYPFASVKEIQSAVEALLSNIHLAPTLECITLRNTVLTLENLETPYSGLHKLKELTLKTIYTS
jgi:hypothetical protein